MDKFDLLPRMHTRSGLPTVLERSAKNFRLVKIRKKSGNLVLKSGNSDVLLKERKSHGKVR